MGISLKVDVILDSAVMNYLLKRGIEKDRMTSEGFGETQPLVPNDSPKNRTLNRRTEIRILVE